MARVRPWWVHAAFVVLTLGLVAIYLTGGLAPNVAVVASSVLPALVLGLQLRSGAPQSRRAWVLMLAGFTLLVVHNVHSLVAVATTGEPAHGITHAATLVSGYLLLLVGGLLATVPLLRIDAGGMIDATIIGLSVAGVAWVIVVRRVQESHGIALADQISQLVLLLLVSVMIGVVVRAAATARDARSAMAYTLLAILAAFTGTLGGALTENRDAGVSSCWIGLCWVVANVAMAAGAAHPTIELLGHQPRDVRLSLGRLAFLGAALAVNPALVGAEYLLGRVPDALLLSLHSLLLVPLVIARIALLARMHASAENRLAVLAARDELTNLPNRRAVTEHLDALLVRIAAGTSPGAAVLFLDLDDFKQVNDQHGHHMGDRLLVEVARRLRGAVRTTDLVGRFGGDEFLLVLEGDPDGARAAGLGAVEQALEPVAYLDTVAASARASIGSAVARPGESTTTEQLLSAADASMYRVKRSRREDAAEAAVPLQAGPGARRPASARARTSA